MLLGGKVRKGQPIQAQMLEAWDAAVEAACAQAVKADREGDTKGAAAAFARLTALVEIAEGQALAALGGVS